MPGNASRSHSWLIVDKTNYQMLFFRQSVVLVIRSANHEDMKMQMLVNSSRRHRRQAFHSDYPFITLFCDDALELLLIEPLSRPGAIMWSGPVLQS